jgi:hypothetical protein
MSIRAGRLRHDDADGTARMVLGRLRRSADRTASAARQVSVASSVRVVIPRLS